MHGLYRKIRWLLCHSEFRRHRIKVILRALIWEWYRFTGRSLTLQIFDFSLRFRSKDGMGRLLFYFREKADEMFVFMAAHLKTGMNFVDVGANIGSHSIYAAKLVRDSGSVICFEADENTYGFLKENIAASGVRNISAYNQCVSEARENVIFNVNKDSAKSSIIRTIDSKTQIPMTADRLDNLLPLTLRIDFLKIDVEGADYLVLQGAQSILLKRPPAVIIIEATSNKQKIIELLTSHQYAIYEFDSSLPGLISPTDSTLNLYALHVSTLEAYISSSL